MHLLEGKNLTKTFGGIVAVSNVSFYVDKGEILGLIGPNGAGKTTLFNLVSGMHAPNSGIVEFNGEKISGLRPYQICPKGIARTFQLTQSFNNLSVIENVMVGALFGKDAIYAWVFWAVQDANPGRHDLQAEEPVAHHAVADDQDQLLPAAVPDG